MKQASNPYISWTVVLAVLLSALLLTGYVRQPTLLNQIKQQGELIVVTYPSPTTYVKSDDVESGFEFDLAQSFANHLGVKLTIRSVENFNQIIPMIASGEAHIAAAGLTITDNRAQLVRFGPAYQQVRQQLVYRAGQTRADSLDELDGYLEVVAGSSHAETLANMAIENERLNWEENYQADVEELLSLVWQKELDYTIADSNQIEISRRYYPELRVAFDVSPPQDLAWAMQKNDDYSLYREAQRFFDKINQNGQLTQLADRHYSHARDFDYVDTRVFIKHINRRLKQYQNDFEQAASKHEQDWRLLAAIGYQESHWNPQAVSPTGVRGIMMLTRVTAAEMGINNRVHPRNSIFGGAQYFSQLLTRIPERIDEPDRTWLALAAYNIGLGHVNDARRITQQRGGDPDKWIDVRDNLPLLMQKRWYQRARHGYARGIEAVQYVENIRNYFDILVWRTESMSDTPATLLVKYNKTKPVVTNEAPQPAL